MKKFVLVLVLLLLACPVYAADIAVIAHAAKASASGAGEGKTVTTDAVNATGATAVFIAVAWYDTGTSPTISDSSMNSYTTLSTMTVDSFYKLSLYYNCNATVSSTFTVTSDTGVNYHYPGIAMIALSNVKTSSCADLQSAGSSGSGITSLSLGSLSFSENSEIAISVLGFEFSATVSIDSSFTKQDQVNWTDMYNMGVALATKIKTNTTAENPSWSWSGSGHAWGINSGFKNANPASSFGTHRRRRL